MVFFFEIVITQLTTLTFQLATLRKKYKTLLEASEASPGASNRRFEKGFGKRAYVPEF